MPVSLSSRPRALVLLLVLLAVEVVGLGVVGVLALVEMTRPQATVAADLFLGLFALVIAGVLVLSMRGLLAGRRWARSPVMTWQLFQIVAGATWFGVQFAVGLAFLLVAVVVIVCLMWPSVVAVTTERAEPAGQE